MFILNLFGKSNNQNEQEKFDKINFKIDLNDNVPKLHDWSEHEFTEEEQFGPNHPLYHEIFPKEEEPYIEYITTQNDTISGLAMKLDLGQKQIRSINSISGSLYPGMKIKLPERTDLSKLEDPFSPKKDKIKISQIVAEPRVHETINAKYSVSYNVGQNGNIRGSLTINSNYLIFNPSLENSENIQKFEGAVERLLKFNAIVETVDIQDANFIEIPVMDDTQNPRKQVVIQFMLYRVGNSKIQKKYKERLKQLKVDHKAIASMTFIIDAQSEKQAENIGHQLVDNVKYIIKESEAKGESGDMEEKNRLTNIPFYDIIHDNIAPKIEEIEKAITGKIISPSAILGGLNDQSDVLSPEEFAGIVKKVPVLYQLYNWSKIYGSTRDGSSFTTFLNRSNGIQPAILLIKEHKGYKFGAFLSDCIRPGKTGRGEMFIFTFRGEQEPEIYHWTGSNEFFVFVDKDKGIGIGMGFKYGIFLKNDLDRGSTGTTATFGNKEILSKKKTFTSPKWKFGASTPHTERP